MTKTVHVAVGVVENAQGQVLIARRPKAKHMGGLWEFPGGKVEYGEPVAAALARELREEVGLQIGGSEPLIQIPFCYSDKKVFLDVFYVTGFTGMAQGCEGQQVCWVSKNELEQYNFPDANKAIIQALRLPESVLVTGEFSDDVDFKRKLEVALKSSVGLVQVRAPQLSIENYSRLIPLVAEYQHRYPKTRFFFNCSPETGRENAVENLHLQSRYLYADNIREQLKPFFAVSASVHSESELELALKAGVDFVYCSPVKPTTSHPGGQALGWEAFAELVVKSSIPVYALGGMQINDIPHARQLGAQGVAGISRFWS